MSNTILLDHQMSSSDHQIANQSIWKALGDPTRRKLLDLVRIAPKTTGELINQFDHLGRCAIMKHLAILEKANLIIPKKVGKYRWNHINAIPIQEIQERWVQKYEEQWAGNLIQIKQLAEFESEKNLFSKNLIMDQVTTLNVLLEIPIKAKIETVWDCLLNDVNLWWRKDFYTSSKTKKFIIEPKVGGRMYEDYGNNEGLLWAEVIVLDSPNNLEFKGHLTPQFGGPAISFLKLSLIKKGDSTILTLSDTVMGAVSEKTKNDLTEGWKMLYEEGFKQYVEKREAK